MDTQRRRWKQFNTHPTPGAPPEVKEKFRSKSKSKENLPHFLTKNSSSKSIGLAHHKQTQKQGKTNLQREIDQCYKIKDKQNKQKRESFFQLKELKNQIETLSTKASQNQKILLCVTALIEQQSISTNEKEKQQTKEDLSLPSSIKNIIPSCYDSVKEQIQPSKYAFPAKKEEAGGSSKTVDSVSQKQEKPADKTDRITSYYFDLASEQ